MLACSVEWPSPYNYSEIDMILNILDIHIFRYLKYNTYAYDKSYMGVCTYVYTYICTLVYIQMHIHTYTNKLTHI